MKKANENLFGMGDFISNYKEYHNIEILDKLTNDKLINYFSKNFELNIVVLFFDENDKYMTGEFIKKVEIYKSYVEFCNKNNTTALTSNKFWRKVKSLFPEILTTRLRCGNSVREYFVKFNNMGDDNE